MIDRKEKQSRRNVCLTDSHICIAKRIGDGNISVGIREALDRSPSVVVSERNDGVFEAEYYYGGVDRDAIEWGNPDGWAVGSPGESRADFEARCKRTWPGCAIIEAEEKLICCGQ